jgi:hypothetical protein
MIRMAASTQFTIHFNPVQQASITLAPLIISLTVAFILLVIVSIYLKVLTTENPKLERLLNIINMALSVIALGAAVLAAYLYYLSSNYHPISMRNWRDMFSPMRFAYAQTPPSHAATTQAAVATASIQPFVGYMLSAIFIALIVVFVLAAITSLFLPDTAQNRSRRTAAQDLVKTFGGFFTGILASFLKQAIGA